MLETLQAFAIFAAAVLFSLLCLPLWIFAAPALIAWFSVPAAPLDAI